MLKFPSAQELSDALEGSRRGADFQARCPAHDDDRPSLSISEKKGKTLFHCHAGCSHRAVEDALCKRGLWPERSGRPENGKAKRSTIVATYDYEDENGEIVSQAVRLSPKRFYQRRPDGNGGWINNLNGVRILPYRLPDVLEGIALERQLWIVEGEKDADALARIGLRATCNAGGAGKWGDEHSAYLRGADVIVLPDHDEPGRKHGEAVAGSLKGIATRVRILTLPGLPEKGDVSDWLAAGGEAEELLKLADAAPDWPKKKKPRVERAKGGDNHQPEHWQLEPWPDHVDGHALLDELVATFSRYLVLPPHAAEALALWGAHAWTIDAVEISPILTVLSPTKQCGKSTVLTVTYYVTPRSVLASNISPAAIFRYIEQEKPTLLIDEADTFAVDDEALRGVLNSGHTRPTASVIRCERQGADIKPRAYSTFAPKVLAAIGKLPSTIMDRSIIVKMRRKAKHEKVERLRLRDSGEFQRLRQRALRWANDNASTIAQSDPEVPSELDNRPADNWRPLLAVADAAGGNWPKQARAVARGLSNVSEEIERGIDLLADIRNLFHEKHKPAMGAEELVTALICLPESPWAEWRPGKDGVTRPITSRGVALMLQPFGIASEKTRGPRLYNRADFEEAWNSYLPPFLPRRR